MLQEHVELVRRLQQEWNRGERPDPPAKFHPDVESLPLRAATETDIETGGLYDFKDGKTIRREDFGSKQKALEAVRRAA